MAYKYKGREREYHRERYANNREKRLEYQRKWYRKRHPNGRCDEARSEYKKVWYSENKDRVKDIQLKRTYGITLEEYKELFVKQDHRCALCKNQFKSEGRSEGAYIDHCHRTGMVRGLLCPKCNTGLGQFNDDPVLLNAALKYLLNEGDTS